jgi:GAF domain-containing protein
MSHIQTAEHAVVPRLALAELSRIRLGTQPLQAVLEQVNDLAQRTIPGVSEVSMTMMHGGRPSTVAFSGSVALHLDERQYEAGFGPCIAAATSGRTIQLDLRTPDHVYRDFSEEARRAGVLHSISVALPVASEVVGGLNLYRFDESPFTAAAVTTAETYAGSAGVAISNAHLYESTAELAANLRRAMESRAVIEQAKGILMVREQCTSEEAFTMLATTSQNTNRKVRDLAEEIVAELGG